MLMELFLSVVFSADFCVLSTYPIPQHSSSRLPLRPSPIPIVLLPTSPLGVLLNLSLHLHHYLYTHFH
jgi:hypothetical protein